MRPSIIREHVDLSQANTLAVSSCARYFARCPDRESLFAVLRWATSQGVAVYVLGEGSNALLPERIEGLVIQLGLAECEVLSRDDQKVLIRVAAGHNWHEFVLESLEREAYGLENLALIPGSVGAAPIQNIGAYGVELSRFVDEVEVLRTDTLQIMRLQRDDCQFGYRDSIFKQEAGRHLLVLSVLFSLLAKPRLVLDYPALRSTLERDHNGECLSGPSELSPLQLAEAVMQIRSAKLPDPKQIPNVGSFFKNPLVPAAHYGELRLSFPEMPGFESDSGARVKIPAAWLIDAAGWKQKEHAAVRVHPHQALVLTNPERRPLTEVLAVARAIQEDIQGRFGIALEIEPQFLRALLP